MTIVGKDTRGNDIPLHGEVVAVREEGGRFEVIPADTIINLAAHPNSPTSLDLIDWQPAADFLKGSYQSEKRSQCREERQHFARIIREYLERSFDARIKKSQERAMLLAAQASSKPEYKLTADEARKQVDELQRSRQERLEGLKRLEIARTGPVRHIASALVLHPEHDTDAQLAALAEELDPNIRRQSELAAEEVVIASLVEEGFPRDRIERVGHLKLGFDIRAHRVIDEVTGELIARRIEVKGRVRGQPIRLTTNEWYKAQQLADTYWLYVVWDPLGSTPEMVSIHNPVARLDHAKREIVAARFFEIPSSAIDACR
jgi:hypothetical protein